MTNARCRHCIRVVEPILWASGVLTGLVLATAVGAWGCTFLVEGL